MLLYIKQSKCNSHKLNQPANKNKIKTFLATVYFLGFDKRANSPLSNLQKKGSRGIFVHLNVVMVLISLFDLG